jgi:hypothetical protein
MPVNVGTNIISSSSITSGYFNKTIVNSGLVCHLDAGNKNSYSGSGSTWNDLSGYGNTVTLYNTGFSTERGGGGIQFGYNAWGVHNIVNAPYQGNFTMSMVFKHTRGYNFGDWDWLYTMNNYGNGMTLTTLGQKPRMNYGQWFTDAISTSNAAFTSTLTLNQYYYITFGRNGNTCFCYVNANQQGQWQATSATPTLTNIRIGCPPNNNVAQEWWDGIINVVHVYNKALSAGEIANNYYALKNRFSI